MEDHTAGLEGDLLLADVLGVIGGEGLHMLFGDHEAIAVPQAGFEQHLNGIGQVVDVAEVAERVETKDGEITEFRLCIKGVLAHGEAPGLGCGIGIPIQIFRSAREVDTRWPLLTPG